MRLAHKYQAGLGHLEAGRLGSAEASLKAFVSANPNVALGHYNLGVALRGRDKLKAAAHAFRMAAALEPSLAPAHGALAAVLLKLGEAQAAEAPARRAVELAPNAAAGHVQLGAILVALGRLAEAEAVYDAALAFARNDAELRFGNAFLRLLQGNYAAGWPDYEVRPARRGPLSPALQPQWRGEDPAGKTLLLYAEQGFGDSIQFLRYAPMLAARGARLLVALPPPLAELAARVEGVAEIVAPSLQLPRFDMCMALGTLPLLCATRPDAIPAAQGYLTAPPERIARWRDRLGAPDRFTVALAWAGNPGHPNDHNRSIPLAELAPLFQVQGVRWLSVQKGPAAAELARLRGLDLMDLGGELTDFADTAAVLACADLTISVDTAPCHLGGALGRPTWTLLPFAPDWRWLTGRSDSPWYGSMRLYRQARLGDWSAPVAEAARDLAAMLAGAAGVEASPSGLQHHPV